MAVDLTRIGDGIVKCLTMTLGKPSMDKEMVMAAQEIGTEGLYRNRAYGWRATNERKGVTKDCAQWEQLAGSKTSGGGPEDRLEWPLSLSLCHYTASPLGTHPYLPTTLGLCCFFQHIK